MMMRQKQCNILGGLIGTLVQAGFTDQEIEFALQRHLEALPSTLKCCRLTLTLTKEPEPAE